MVSSLRNVTPQKVFFPKSRSFPQSLFLHSHDGRVPLNFPLVTLGSVAEGSKASINLAGSGSLDPVQQVHQGTSRNSQLIFHIIIQRWAYVKNLLKTLQSKKKYIFGRLILLVLISKPGTAEKELQIQPLCYSPPIFINLLYLILWLLLLNKALALTANSVRKCKSKSLSFHC